MSSNDWLQLLPIAVLLGFMYLLFIRPARKRARETASLQQALSAGDEVMLTSGIFGHVTGVADDRVNVEVAPGVVVTTHRGAVAQIIHDEPADAGATSTDPPGAESTAPTHDDDDRPDQGTSKGAV